MAKRKSAFEAAEAAEPVEVVEAVEAADGGEAVDVVEVDSGSDAAGADDGVSIYTAMLIVSTVAYLTAMVVAAAALKDYVDPAKWPL